MQDVNIYIAGTIHGPAKKAGGYLYILECFRDGQAVTLEKSAWMEKATENQLALTALGEALGRLNCPCSPLSMMPLAGPWRAQLPLQPQDLHRLPAHHPCHEKQMGQTVAEKRVEECQRESS